MEIKQTIQILIEPDEDLRETLEAFRQVKQSLSNPCFNAGDPLNQIELHRSSYSSVAGKVNSQMTCSAIRLVAASYITAKRNGHKIDKFFNFKRRHALFLIGKKGRDADFRKDGTLSIWTVSGRKRINYTVPEYFKPFLREAKEIDSINVVDRKGRLIGLVCLALEVPDPKGIHPVGVDLNETNVLVAVDADNQELFIPGISHSVANTKTRKTKKRLQRKLSSRKAEKRDTRSVRRLLKRLARKQSNRTKTFCQTVAKQFVSWCPEDSVIVLEDLKIPKVSKKMKAKKGVQRRLSQWARGTLTTWINSNAEKRGILVVKVNPAYTSQDCSRCGLRGIRHRHKFLCPSCSFSAHADLNAAVNIRNRYTVLRHSGALSMAPEALPTSTVQVHSGEGKLTRYRKVSGSN
ncbi:MAG: Transposase, IS605 OrfB family [Candidatus Gottesmanbacteria bacterium GW2011_GWB1_49_7]|uniref:Transposase, IS605 OrfB family n=1 Tax=Candidatus Gottesmanbacteria bacterium GW2011_GWB1_49_7 TaxID=1618448 RepID=A0A0G1VUS0_9BACT|nr:MAG: Transposase, IS605 OrfB family [Candidatus Gottesmanbacteria bacterium GW2011_GWB1_49_7]